MKTKLIFSALVSLIMAGCASTSGSGSEAVLASGPMADCNLESLEERGPVRPSLYVVGTFPDGQWIHMESRKMSYKGEGIYQVVSQEKEGFVNLQFATMGWNPQYTAAGLEMEVGFEKALKRGGFAKNTKVKLPEAGQYLWSIKIAEDKKPVAALVSQCK